MDGISNSFERIPESQTEFLKRIEPYLHVDEWLDLIQPILLQQKAEGDRSDKNLKVLLRIILVQHIFSLSDDAILKELRESSSLCAFVSLSKNDSHMPTHEDIVRFRNLIKKRNIEKRIADDLTGTLTEHGLLRRVASKRESVKKPSKLTLIITFSLLVLLSVTAIVGTVLVLNMISGRTVSFAPPKTPAPTVVSEQNTDNALDNGTFMTTDHEIVVWLDIDNVIMYEEASVEATVLTVLTGKQEVILLDSSNGWCHIQVGDTVGYVNLSIILTSETNHPSNNRHYKIAIDAGHQAKGNYEQEPIGPESLDSKAKVSSGTQGVATNVPEYQLNLSVSQKLRDELISRGYEVVMIRETNDVNISNRERAEIATENGADIFVRVHADAADSSTVNGVLVLCPTEKNPFVSHLYADSLTLSKKILLETVATTGANNRHIFEVDNMSGINWSTMPVTIVEMGLMTNPDEDRLMQTESYQRKLAIGIANGIDGYFSERE